MILSAYGNSNDFSLQREIKTMPHNRITIHEVLRKVIGAENIHVIG